MQRSAALLNVRRRRRLTVDHGGAHCDDMAIIQDERWLSGH